MNSSHFFQTDLFLAFYSLCRAPFWLNTVGSE
jgi:hypothetical protein